MLRRMMMAGASSSPINPPWANVSALLHFDGADGSTSIVDETGKTWTRNGNAQLDTDYYRFGGSSLLLDGVDDDITHSSHSDFGFGTGDFTWECFVRKVGATDQVVFDNRSGSDSATFVVFINSTGNLVFYDTSSKVGSGATVPLLTWTHIAITRASGTQRMFVGGTQVWVGSRTTDMGSARPMRIGRDIVNNADFNGHIDEVRITKGVALYTAAFNPPTVPFPNS